MRRGRLRIPNGSATVRALASTRNGRPNCGEYWSGKGDRQANDIERPQNGAGEPERVYSGKYGLRSINMNPRSQSMAI